MHGYRRILAVIELGPDGEQVAGRAAALAQLTGARLALATIADTVGEESSLAPVLTPRQARAALAASLKHRLTHLATRIDAQQAELLVLAGPRSLMIEELVEQWQPDLVLAAAHKSFGLERHQGGASTWDLLLVRLPAPRSLTGRLVHRLAWVF